MEVKIKRIGNERGTSGWLAKGLENGDIEITEGRLKGSGNHALFIHYKSEEKEFSEFLAGYDHLRIGSTEYTISDGEERQYENNIWTPAAYKTLLKIAQQWCDMCNAERENDPELKSLSIVRT